MLTTITFDDLPPVAGESDPIPDGYAGFDWDMFYYMNGASYWPNSGYDNGTVSGEHVAFNAWANIASLGDSPFWFDGAYLTAAWNTGLNIEVTGYLEGVQKYSQTVVVDPWGPTYFNFNYRDVDEVVFRSYGGSNAGLGGGGAHFAMDNVVINPMPRIVEQLPSDPSVGPLAAVQFDFSRTMDQESFSVEDDIVSFIGPQGPVAVTDHQWIDEDTLGLTFDLQYEVGTYEMVVGPEILDTDGNPMNEAHTAIFAVGAPQVTAQTPSGSVAGPVGGLQLSFDHPMDQTSFSPEDDVISFTGPDGPVAVSGSRWLGDQTLEVLFDPQSSLGAYELVLGPEVLSLWNNPLDQDGDLVVAEAPDDWYTATFTIAGAKVMDHTPSGYVTAPVQRMQFSFDQPMEEISFSPEDDVVSFTGPNGPIAINDHRWINPQTLELGFDQQNTAGEYELVLGPQILNLAGIAMDQDEDFNVGEEPDDQYMGTFTRMFVSNITEDTVWGPIDPPIIFDSTVTVASGATLTIEAGSTLKFSGGARLVVNGNLDIRGTLDAPVILTSYRDDEAGGDTNGDGDATSPAANDWGGIRFNSSATGTLQNVEIAYASTAIDADAQYANVTMRNAVLRDGGRGIYVYSPYAEIDAENCLIADNQRTGVYMRASSGGVYRNCTIVGNGFGGSGLERAGIHIGAATMLFDNCIIAFNANGINHSSADDSQTTVRHSAFYNPGGQDIIWTAGGPRPPLDQNGNITADPLFIDRSAGNYELGPGSPAIDSGRGIHAPSGDILGRARRDDQGMPNVGTGYPAFVDMGAYERQEDCPTADLMVTYVSHPDSEIVTAGDTFNLEWTVSNIGAVEAVGTWQDFVYLSDDPHLGGDELLATVDHTDPVAAGASYTESVVATVPATSGPKYVLVHTKLEEASDQREAVETNNLGVSARVLAVDVPLLELGTPLGATATYDQWDYYRFQGEPGRTVLLTLDGEAGSAALYLRRTLPPALSNYDVVGNLPNQPDQELRLLDPVADTYYVGVFPKSLGGGSGSYTLSADLTTLDIREVTPNEVGNAGTATIKILGDAFDPAAEVQLVAPDSTIIEGDEYSQDSATLFATFDLAAAGAAPGLYDVVVTNPGAESVTAYDAVTVADGGVPGFSANLSMPGVTRPGRVVDVRIDYRNTSTVDILAPHLRLESGAQDCAWSLPWRDGWVEGADFCVMALSSEGPPTILRPGQSESIVVELRVPFRPERVNVSLWSVGAVPTDGSSDPIDWQKFENEVRPLGVDPDIWEPAFANLQTQIGATWGDYAETLRGNVNRWHAAGRRVYCVRELFGMEMDRAYGVPTGIMAGRLKDADSGLPIGNVNVEAWDIASGSYAAGVADEHASFFLYGLSSGELELAVTGHLVSEGQSFELPAAEDLLNLEVEVTEAGHLVGTITAEVDGQPIEGADLSAFSCTGEFVDAASTDKYGRYRFDELPADTYTVRVSHEDFVGETIAGITVALGKTRSDIDFSLVVGATVVGSVTRASDGTAIENASVVVEEQTLGFTGGAHTAADGTYRLSGLPVGVYEVEVGCDGYLSETIPSVAIGPEDPLDLGVVALGPPAAISGTVVSTDPDTPVGYTYVGVFAGQEQVATASVQFDGSFQVDSLRAGTYSLRVVGVVREEFSSSVTLPVAAGEEIGGVLLNIVPGATIQGVVRDGSTSIPLDGVCVTLVKPDGALMSTVTDANGEYRFDGLVSADYLVTLGVTGASTSRAVSVTGIDGDIYTADLKFESVAQISGRLSLADGSAPVNGAISLYECERLVVGTTADEDGNYRFDLLRGGTFELRGFAKGATFDPVTGVAVVPGVNVTRDMPAGDAGITLTVTDPSGDVTGASVYLYHLVDGEPLFTEMAELDASGAVSFANLAAGSYEISVFGPNNRGGRTTVSVSSGSTSSANLELAQGFQLTGSVTDDAGDPIPGARVTAIAADGSGRHELSYTDAEGRYAIGQIDAGTYTVVVTATGYEALIQDSVTLTENTAWDCTLSPSTARVAGRLVDSAGRPIVVATISIVDSEGYVLGIASPNSAGEFVVDAVVADDLTLVIEVPGFVDIEIEGISVVLGVTDLGDLTLDPVALARAGTSIIAGAAMYPPLPADRPGASWADTLTPADPSVVAELAVGLLAPTVDIVGLLTDVGAPITAASIPTWLSQLFTDVSPSDREVEFSDLPSLSGASDECFDKCYGAWNDAFNAVKSQNWAWESLKNQENILDWTLRLAVATWTRNVAVAVGTGLGAVVAVKGILASAGIIAVYSPHIAWQVIGAATSILQSIIDIKDTVTSLDSPGAAGNLLSTTVGVENTMVETRDAWARLAKRKETKFLGPVLSLLSSAIYFIGGGFKGAIQQLVDLSFEVEKDVDDFESLRKNYLGAVDDANEDLAAYKSCLANCDEEDDPDPEDEEEDEDSTDPRRSDTPEDKFGPAGYDAPDTPEGSEVRYVPAEQTLDYRVDFWNKEDAPVPTQDAIIMDQLDPDVVDLSTLEFTRIGFLNWDVKLPGGQVVDTRIDCRPEMDLAVEVKAGLGMEVPGFANNADITPSTLVWWFHAIDPETGEWPEDPMAGFLPPYNPETGYEIGWVEFKVDPVEGLASGTELANLAYVEFDFAGDIYDHPAPKVDPDVEPAEPAPWINTVDAGVPQSHVLPLPATSSQAAFLVQWTGQDEENGSGLADYDVYVSTDGSAYQPWLEDITGTSAVFPGDFGHTYAFYSIATDNVGHHEPPPAAPDAQITIPPNQKPVANDDFPVMDEDTAALIDVLGNDTDDGTIDPTRLRITYPAGHGSLVVNPDGTITYTPEANYCGTDSFKYKVKDEHRAESNAATVTITLNAINDPPVITSFSATPTVIDEGETVTVTGEFTDPDLSDVHTVVIDWGDGTSDTLILAVGARTFSASHPYPDDDPTGTPSDDYRVRVTVSDDHGGSTCPPMPAGMLAYWSFDDAGSPGDDDSGNGRNVELMNGAAYQPIGLSAGALRFDGIDDYAIDDDAGDYLNGLSEITVAMWIKADAIPVDRGFWEARDSGDGDVWGVRYDSAGANNGDQYHNLIKAGVTTSTSGGNPNRSQDQYESGEYVQTTNWQHVAITWEDGVGFKMYIDGVLDTPTFPMSNMTGTVDMVEYFVIGDGAKNCWQGLIDEVCIFDRAVDVDEVAALYAAGFGITVTVNNVAPTLSDLSLTPEINEGDFATLSGTISDPGTQDTFTLEVDWDDGSPLETFSYDAGTTSFSVAHQYVDDNPSGTPSDDYTVSFTLTDDDTGSAGEGPLVWTGPTMTFTKADYVDWTLPANQDRITDNVWITRQNDEGVFNIKTEVYYTSSWRNWDEVPSPANTEWAYGSASDWESLTFSNWAVWHNWDPPDTVGEDAVLHLIEEDVYLDIEFLSWTSGGMGGGFSYERATPAVPGEKVWTGPTITFAKDDYADWTDPANQDQITPTTSITRRNTKGIFNFKSELAYDFWTSSSPADTEWAFGSAFDWQSLGFGPWAALVGGWNEGPTSILGKDLVLHLISDDIYVDVKFTSWTSGGDGGGFSYDRSSESAGTVTSTVTVNNMDPTAAIEGAPASCPVGTVVDLSCSVTDPGVADTFTYAWAVTKDGSAYASGTSADLSFTPDEPATYVVTLDVTDDDGGVGTDSKTIEVTGGVPLRIEEVTVNDGDAQRSNIETITARFDQAGNLQELIDGGAIATAVQLYDGGNQQISLEASRFVYNAATFELMIDLTTDGFGGSRSTMLADGRYELRLDTALITGLVDDDGVEDSIREIAFHRLLADFDGDAQIDLDDRTRFFEHYGTLEENPLYDFAFDLDGDGMIGRTDYYIWKRRFGMSV